MFRFLEAVIETVLGGDTSSKTREGFKCLIRSITLDDPSIDAVLLGCTELSVLIDGVDEGVFGVDVVDPELIVAKALCRSVMKS